MMPSLYCNTGWQAGAGWRAGAELRVGAGFRAGAGEVEGRSLMGGWMAGKSDCRKKFGGGKALGLRAEAS